MNGFLVEAIVGLLGERHELDPTESVPVYDLHNQDGTNTGYCLVRSDWLDEVWLHAKHRAYHDLPMIPHDHLDPSVDR